MIDHAPPPHPTGAPNTKAVLKGTLLPWDGPAPTVLSMPGSPHIYIPLFTTEEKMRATMGRAGVAFDRIMHVEDEDALLASLPEEVIVIVDPWYTIEGKVRFLQIIR